MSDDQPSASSPDKRPVSVQSGLVQVGIVISALVLLKWSVDYFKDDSPNAVGFDEQVSSLGAFEVTAKLVRLPKKLPEGSQEPSASLFQYDILKVHRGSTDRRRIFVAHYNPTRSRADAADTIVRDVGGKLTEFRKGDRHRLALATPLEKYYQGKLIDDFPKLNDKGQLYWAVWTNPVR